MNIKSKKGFTIIEVVLVLAIAGLIFLMVFIALPAMQRNQRDTQRRNDYSALSANVTNYITNNNGKTPTLNSTLDPTMVNGNGQDPYGESYVIQVITCSSQTTSPTAGTACDSVEGDKAPNVTGSPAHAYVILNATCDGATPKYKKGVRNYAIYGAIENEPKTYCQASNQ